MFLEERLFSKMNKKLAVDLMRISHIAKKSSFHVY